MTVMHTDSRPSVVTGLHEEAQGQTFVQRIFSTIEAEEMVVFCTGHFQMNCLD